MRVSWRVLLGGAAMVSVLVAACVGDDVSSSIVSTPDGGNAPVDASHGDTDASTSPDASSDAEADAGPRCNLDAPFQLPTLVPGLPVMSGTGRLSKDETTVFFSLMDDAGAEDLYSATRTSPAEAFGPATKLTLSSAAVDESFPSVSYDGMTFFYTVGPLGGEAGNVDIWSATRTNLLGNFSNATIVAGINSETTDRYPFVTSDGELWFSSSRGGNEDLYRAPFTGSGYAAPVPVSELSSATDAESYPALTADKLRVYFTRPGPATARDIWTATRSSNTAPFGTPSLVTEVSSADDERSAWISPDGCRLYIGKGASSLVSLYVASRPAL